MHIHTRIYTHAHAYTHTQPLRLPLEPSACTRPTPCAPCPSRKPLTPLNAAMQRRPHNTFRPTHTHAHLPRPLLATSLLQHAPTVACSHKPSSKAAGFGVLIRLNPGRLSTPCYSVPSLTNYQLPTTSYQDRATARPLKMRPAATSSTHATTGQPTTTTASLQLTDAGDIASAQVTTQITDRLLPTQTGI